MKQYGARSKVFSQAGDRISQWSTVFEQIKFACDTAPDPERCGKAIREIDALVRRSSENMNYLTEHENAGDTYQRLMKMRGDLLKMAKDLDAHFTPETVVQRREAIKMLRAYSHIWTSTPPDGCQIQTISRPSAPGVFVRTCSAKSLLRGGAPRSPGDREE